MTEILDNELNKNHPPNPHNKILRVNTKIFLSYTFLSLLGGSTAYIFHAIFIVVHVIICFSIGIVLAFSSKSAEAQYHFLSMFLVLLIGFGTCIGFVNIID